MIVVFIGPPKSGKDTQAKLLGGELNLPVFSMGELIREARSTDPKAEHGFSVYSMSGQHLPIELKFHLLEPRLDKNKNNGFILDNFPANQEDLDTFVDYLNKNNLNVNSVFNMIISEEEMMRRTGTRGRDDDTPEVVRERRRIQDEDRRPVIEYFKKQGALQEINGEGEAAAIHAEILARLGISRREKNGL